EKQWKITEEDWRNRDRWDQYEVCVDQMLRLTNTDYAPWYIIESNDKKYARIKTLKLVISAIEKEMGKKN
ncbi:MAG: phosphate--AMP phosphotransferase, partial [Clostridia bacterium]|nr:phosphate--AMP phosphotransferase [Clostridia bacterium]